jgi:uncharacterized membrane protein YdjX (TVP38/TMEM64 family)
MRYKHFFASKDTKKKGIIAIVIISIVIIIALFMGYWLIKFLSNVQQSKEFILSFGIYAPVVFIGLQVFQILLGIIPASPLILIGGYVFGSLLGSLYSIIGITIGSLFAFHLAKRLGRPFVKKIVNKKYINKFDKIKENNLAVTLFVLFLLPMLPNDAFCYLAGLTKLHYKKYLLIVALGRLPVVIMLSFLGFQISKLNTLFTVIAIVLLIFISIILLLQKERISKHVNHNIKKIHHFKKKHSK